jgi:hypothetical protein
MATRLRFTAPLIALTLMTPIVLSIPVHAQQTRQLTDAAKGPLPFVLHAPALLDSIDTIAGHRVQIVNARVLEVVEPRTIVVEANTHYRTLRGQRDRILVFVADGSHRNLAQLAIGSPVTIEGVARTLLSLRTTNEVSWPARLDADEVDDLEVRGAVVGAALVTAEDTRVAGN